MTKPKHAILLCAVLIGAALLVIRVMSDSFVRGTNTFDHPFIVFFACLSGAGLIWLAFIPLIKRLKESGKSLTKLVWIIVFVGLVFRAIFFGSTTIYEDDWKRYLWDGYVVTQGDNPYKASPQQILIVDPEKPNIYAEYQAVSHENDNFLHQINNPHLTTIYPPVAQAVFGLAAYIAPFNLDALRFLFLLSEIAALALLIKALTLYGRSPLWSALYALNPLVIYSGFNVVHMDVLLVPFIFLAMICIKRFPFRAAIALSFAAAVKLWPLLLAPIFYASWRNRPLIFIGSALLVSILTLGFFWPMLAELNDGSGLKAYSGSWQRSSFLYRIIQSGLSALVEDPSLVARLLIAAIVSGVSIYWGLWAKVDDDLLPRRLLFVTALLFFLSPTGYPWYGIWLIIFLPFLPSYGIAMLSVTLPLYYLRFALGEREIYHIYTDILVPIQFGIPLLIIGFELWRERRYAKQ